MFTSSLSFQELVSSLGKKKGRKARFKVVMAERAINHLNKLKLVRMKTITTSYIPLVFEEGFD